MRKFLLLFSMSFSAPAIAADLSLWASNYDECGSWAFERPYEEFLQGGIQFEKQAELALAEVQKFSTQTCPNYVNRANASHSIGSQETGLQNITLAEFIRAQKAMGEQSDLTYQQAKKLQAWVEDQLTKKEALYRETMQASLSNSACAISMAQAREHTLKKTKELELAIHRIDGKCGALATELAKDKRTPAASLVHADGGPGNAAHTPGGAAKNRGNTITGVDESKAKDSQYKGPR